MLSLVSVQVLVVTSLAADSAQFVFFTAFVMLMVRVLALWNAVALLLGHVLIKWHG